MHSSQFLRCAQYPQYAIQYFGKKKGLTCTWVLAERLDHQLSRNSYLSFLQKRKITQNSFQVRGEHEGTSIRSKSLASVKLLIINHSWAQKHKGYEPALFTVRFIGNIKQPKWTRNLTKQFRGEKVLTCLTLFILTFYSPFETDMTQVCPFSFPAIHSMYMSWSNEQGINSRGLHTLLLLNCFY